MSGTQIFIVDVMHSSIYPCVSAVKADLKVENSTKHASRRTFKMNTCIKS